MTPAGAWPGGRIILPEGVPVARLGVGCWPIGGPADNLGMPMGWSTADDGRALAGLERAFELGARLFDTADVYGLGHSERLLGQLLRGVDRRQVALSSKVGYFAGTAPHGYEPGHMRRQLEQTLENLGTDYLDIYALHHPNFGPHDVHLPAAVDTMRTFQKEGLIRAVGMRGPHRYAPERLARPAGADDKHARFRRQFTAIRPQVLAVRDNLLTPQPAGSGIREFAAEHGVTVLVTKPLAQGLLTGKHLPEAPPVFGPGDHRLRKAWFTAPALTILQRELAPLRERFGPERADLVWAALRYLLTRWPDAAVLVGFTTTGQVEQTLACPSTPLTAQDMDLLTEAGRRAQQALDDLGEVFTDE